MIIELTWKEVRQKIAEKQPKLYSVVENLSPPDHFKLYLARYTFAEKIIDNGKLQLPKNVDPMLEKTTKEQLSYSAMPISLLLDRSCELYHETPDGIASLAVMKPGDIVGLYDMLETQGMPFFRQGMTLVSGVRSMFMLPKVSDTNGHGRLRKDYGFDLPSPKNLQQQWPIFAELAKQTADVEPWCSELLLFGQDWYEHLKFDQNWLNFQVLLYEMAWQEAKHNYAHLSHKIMWESLSKELSKNGVKVEPYLLETARCIVNIGLGYGLGFKVADSSNQQAPTDLIQQAYLDSYGLKTYAPLLMVPSYFENTSADERIYYSLQFPNALISTPRVNNTSNVIAKLRELKNIFQFIQTQFHAEDPVLDEKLKQFTIKLFHSDADPSDNICCSSEVLAQDKLLQKMLATYPERSFPETATFFRGALGIEKVTTNTEHTEQPQQLEYEEVH